MTTASGLVGTIIQIKLGGVITKETVERKYSFSSDLLVAVLVMTASLPNVKPHGVGGQTYGSI